MADPFNRRKFDVNKKEPIETLYEDLGILLYIHDRAINRSHIILNHALNEINVIIQMKQEEGGETK
jgi:hypothetical protein